MGAAQGPFCWPRRFGQLPRCCPHIPGWALQPLAGVSDLRGLAEPLPARLALAWAIRGWSGAAGVCATRAWDPKQPLVGRRLAAFGPRRMSGGGALSSDLALLTGCRPLAFDGCGFRLGRAAAGRPFCRSDRAWPRRSSGLSGPSGCQVEDPARDPGTCLDGWAERAGPGIGFQPVSLCRRVARPGA